MKNLHTSGPWYKPNESFHILDSDKNFIIATIDATTLIPREEKRANARLISLAPEMLEALEEITETFKSCLGGSDPLHYEDFEQEFKKVYSLINKAKGIK
jgi:hypothetical protein